MTALRALHATRNKAGLSEDDAREIYQRVVGKTSTRAMTDAERYTCRNEIARLYPQSNKHRSNGSQKRLTGKYAKKFQALWIAAWNLGIVRDRSDAALIKFATRQTGIDHVNWMRSDQDASKVIEALKSWMAREAGVDWKTDSSLPKWLKEPRAKVASAQFWMLVYLSGSDGTVDGHLFYRFIQAHQGLYLEEMEKENWVSVMNDLGHRIRGVKQL